MPLLVLLPIKQGLFEALKRRKEGTRWGERSRSPFVPFVLTVNSFHLQTADTRAEMESL